MEISFDFPLLIQISYQEIISTKFVMMYSISSSVNLVCKGRVISLYKYCDLYKYN